MSQALVGEGKKRTAEDIDKLLRANLDEFSESSISAMSRILERGLQEDKAGRYSSVDEMLKDFLELNLIQDQ